MKKISLDEIKQIELNILKEFHNFCEQNKLTYYLAYGTLLGAVRHKGFIPWDDDIDVFMPRKDYDILVDKFNEIKKNKNLKLISVKQYGSFHLPFAKIYNNNTEVFIKDLDDKVEIGVWIDIFPLDNLSSSYKKAKKLQLKNRILNFIKYRKFMKYNYTNIIWKRYAHNILKFALFFISKKYIINKIITNSQKYKNYENSKYIGNVDGSNTNILERVWFKDKILLDFESCKFWVPKQYDKLLNRNYGNYMQLPPENKRICHSIEAYWKDK